MKIDNSRVFKANIYQVANSRSINTVSFGDVEFGSYDYDSIPMEKNVIVVYFKERNCYVPIWNLKNVSNYASVRFGSGYEDERILFKDPGFMPRNGKRFVEDVEPLFNTKGRTSVEELIKMQIDLSRDEETLCEY